MQFLVRGLAQFQAMGGGMFLLARSRAQLAFGFPVLYVIIISSALVSPHEVTLFEYR